MYSALVMCYAITIAPSHKHKRQPFSNEQLSILLHKFEQNIFVTREDIPILIQQTGLTEKQIKEWFNNQRKSVQKKAHAKNDKTNTAPIVQAHNNTLQYTPNADINTIHRNDSIDNKYLIHYELIQHAKDNIDTLSSLNNAYKSIVGELQTSICNTSKGNKLVIPQSTLPDNDIWRRPNRQICFMCNIEGIGLRYCSHCIKYYHESCVQHAEVYHKLQQNNNSSSIKDNSVTSQVSADNIQQAANNVINNNKNTDYNNLNLPDLPPTNELHHQQTQQTTQQHNSSHNYDNEENKQHNTTMSSVNDNNNTDGSDNTNVEIVDWTCPWHYCYDCHTHLSNKPNSPPVYSCVCCPRSFCGNHYYVKTDIISQQYIYDTHQYWPINTGTQRYKKRLDYWYAIYIGHI